MADDLQTLRRFVPVSDGFAIRMQRKRAEKLVLAAARFPVLLQGNGPGICATLGMTGVSNVF